jgi:hypothetical protein
VFNKNYKTFFTSNQNDEILVNEYHPDNNVNYYFEVTAYFILPAGQNNNDLTFIEYLNSEFNENFIPLLKKIHLINSHLNISLTFNNKIISYSNIILELKSYTLTIPDADMMKKYIEKNYEIEILKENYFSVNTNGVELLIILYNGFEKNENFMDLIISKNRLINSYSIDATKFILAGEKFKEILINNYNIKLSDTLSNINKIKIQNENNKSIFIIVNHNLENIENFIEIFINALTKLAMEIREKNILLLLNTKERKIFNEYERSFNVISRSLITIFKHVCIYYLIFFTKKNFLDPEPRFICANKKFNSPTK